jgi:hypothetical protein
MISTQQPIFEQHIYVGLKPPEIEPPQKEAGLESLEIFSDSTKYTRRSPVELLIQSDINLEATLSISVYQDSYNSQNQRFKLSKESSGSEVAEPEEEILYMGYLRRVNGTKIANGQLILSMNLPEGQKTFFSNSDSTGFFIFKDLIFQGDQTAFWQINNAKGKLISDAMIHWLKFPSIPLKIDSLTIKEKINVIQQPAIFKSDGDFLNDDSKMLEELIVKAKKTEKPAYLRAMLHNEKDVSFAINFENNQLPNIHDGKVHNFYVMLKMLPTCPPEFPPVYLIDGMKVERPEEVVNTREIKRIELLRGASGAIYGSTCVYAIYTFGVDNLSNSNKNSQPKTVKLNGYQEEKLFYAPRYDTNISVEQDNRQTLYWNPYLILESSKPEQIIRFFTSDISGKYKVIVSGMSNVGPIYTESSFEVE